MHASTIRLAGLITFGLAITGCASTEVRSYVARGMNVQQHRTYNWAAAEARPTGDPRLDNNRFFQECVQTAVESQLAHRGFEKSDSPALLVRYFANVAQDTYISGSGRIDGSCDDCRPEVYEAGTLLIDLVDAQTGGLVWRGWAKGSIDGAIDNQKWMEERIDEAVARILQKLP